MKILILSLNLCLVSEVLLASRAGMRAEEIYTVHMSTPPCSPIYMQHLWLPKAPNSSCPTCKGDQQTQSWSKVSMINLCWVSKGTAGSRGHSLCPHQNLLSTQEGDYRVLRKYKRPRNSLRSFLIDATSLYQPTTYSENDDMEGKTEVAGKYTCVNCSRRNPRKFQHVTPKAHAPNKASGQLCKLCTIVYHPVNICPKQSTVSLGGAPPSLWQEPLFSFLELSQEISLLSVVFIP